MKKVLLTLIMSVVFGGTIFAQHESHWSDFNSGPFEMPDAIIAFVQINGEYVTFDGNWADLEIGAFVGDEVRGHAFMAAYVEEGDPFPILELNVFHMLDSIGEVVSFKLYDHATGIEYDACTASIEILTGSDHFELYYNYDEAVILSFTTAQTIALAAGWNWISFNVETTLADLKAALVEVAVAGDQPIIKSQRNGQTKKNANNNNWMGALSTLDMSQMYKIKVGADCEITLEGLPINPAEHPATIMNGANWIAFPLSESMAVAEAFSNFNATTNDIVKSQGDGQTRKTSTSWMGQLQTLDPGKGYIYNSKSTATKTLVFPTPAK